MAFEDKTKKELLKENDSLKALKEKLATELKVADKELKALSDSIKQTSQYERSLIETSLDPFVIISLEGKITDVNEASVKVTGISRNKLIGTDFFDYFTQTKEAKKEYQNIFQKGGFSNYPLTMRHKNGKMTDLLLNTSVYKDVKGNVLCVFAAGRDITEKKEKAIIIENKELLFQNEEKRKREVELIQAKAEESYIKMTSLINNLPALIYREKSDNDLAFITNTENITGYSEADFITKKINWVDLILPTDKEKVVKNCLNIKTRPKSTKQHYRIITKENVIKYLADFNTSLFSKEGVFIGVDGLVFDISKEKLLQKREIYRTKVMEKIAKGEKLNAVLEFIVREVEAENPKSLFSILILSDDRKKLLLGIAPSLPAFFKNAINGIEIGEGDGICEHAVFTGERVIIEDIQTHPRGKFVKEIAKKANLAACWSQPIIGSLGKVLGTFAIYHKEIARPTEDDISEMESLADMARIAIESSQSRDDLIKAKEQAEESGRLKSAFLANMSHEIRTPMNGILGFADLLKTPNLSGEDQQEYIDIIEKSGQRMLNILNDIVNVSKIESGLMEVNIQNTNINEQIDFIYSFFKPEIKGKGIRFLIKNSLKAKEAYVLSDNEKIYGILTNLIKNAVKFTEEGTIELGCHLRTGKPSLELEFYVKDTGIGIPKDRQKAIFDRFIQADISGKMAYQGAGLGLSISKAYVELLGGKIWVEGEEGKGSIFYFTLPYLNEYKEKNITKIGC